ncbi:MAG: ACP phosphodiesterase [Salibacteraceae bacterium]
MNFLAHFHLSGNNEEIAIGNFLGDFIRGTKPEELPPLIYKGLKLHRFIDEFTDSHHLVKQTNKILQPYFKKYTPVVSDVYFDYFLAHHFDDYSKISLRDYTYDVYELLCSNKSLLTPRASRFYDFMIVRDIFFEYGNKDGMQHVFRGLASRAKFESNMLEGVSILTKHEIELYKLFKGFYPELQQASATYLNQLLRDNQ